MVPDGLIDIFATLCSGGVLCFTVARLFLSARLGYVRGHEELARYARSPGDGVGLAAALLAYGIGVGVAGLADRFATDSEYWPLDKPSTIRERTLYKDGSYTSLGVKVLVAREAAVSEALEVSDQRGRVRPDCGDEAPFIPLSEVIGQIYYSAKNSVYAIEAHAVELTRIADQIDFVRTTFYLLCLSAALDIVVMLLTPLTARLWRQGTESATDYTAPLAVALVTAGIALTLTNVHTHLQEQYLRRVFGYYATLVQPEGDASSPDSVRPVELTLPASTRRPAASLADLEFSGAAALAWDPDTDRPASVLLAPEEPSRSCPDPTPTSACLYEVDPASVLAAARCGGSAPIRPVPITGPATAPFEEFLASAMTREAPGWTVEGIEAVTPLRDGYLGLLFEVTRAQPTPTWSALLCTAAHHRGEDGSTRVTMTGTCQLLEAPGTNPAPNLGYESLVYFSQTNLLLVLPERLDHAAALGVQPSHDGGLSTARPVPAPGVPFRLTDAAVQPGTTDGEALEGESFLAINYYYPGEAEHTWPGGGEVVQVGAAKVSREAPFARLVRSERVGQGMGIVEDAVAIPQFGATGENWEALAWIDDRHLLMVADRYGVVLAAVVALPPENPPKPW